jgi:hypothetical protein
VDIRVGDVVEYGSQRWRVVATNALYVWLSPTWWDPAWTPVRVLRAEVVPADPAERSGE